MASKGLDFPGIKHVINYDMPDDIENYVHRIGRTGRSGAKGMATTFVNKANDESVLLDLKALLMESKQVVGGCYFAVLFYFFIFFFVKEANVLTLCSAFEVQLFCCIIAILFVSNYCGNWFRIQATTLKYLRTSTSQLLFFYVTILLPINLRINRIIDYWNQHNYYFFFF